MCQHLVLNRFPPLARANFTRSVLKPTFDNRSQFIAQALLATR
jgi:hypothetical protein